MLRRQCAPELLHTYSAERQAVAQELIDFDREWAKMFSAPRKTDGADGEGVDPAEFQKLLRAARALHGRDGHALPAVVICGEATHQHLATGLSIGTRFHSAPVVRIADARPVQLGHAGKADGRWRLYAFAGARHLRRARRSARCASFLPSRRTRRCADTRPAGADIDCGVRRAGHLPAGPPRAGHRVHARRCCCPARDATGLRDYEKMFCPDLKGGHDIFDLRGIDRAAGRMVVVRPDQYIAHVLPLDAYAELAAFFDGFMIQEVTENSLEDA